jgi:MFS family permease
MPIAERGMATPADRKLTRKDMRTLALSSLGGGLEYYDFTVFVFFAAIIGEVFFPPDTPEWLRQAQAFAIFAIGFVVRPIGGIVIAHFGDRFGRKKLFMFTLLLMAVPTLLIGLLPTYAMVGVWAPILLLLMRMLQGLAVAGEVPGSVVFVTEHVPASRVGFGGACLFGALNFGLFLGALVGALTAAYMDRASLLAWGWRVAFIAGGVFGLVSVYLRKYLEETPMFQELRQTRQAARTVPLKEVLQRYMRSVVFVVGLALLLSEVNAVMFQFMPTFLQTHYKLPKPMVFQANTVAIVTLAAMCPVWGWIGDRIGLGRALVTGAIGTAVATWWFFSHLDAVAAGTSSLLACWILIALPAGFIGLIPALAAVVFPTPVRFTGVALPYNVGTALFAGFTPLLLTYLVQGFGLASPAWLVVGACGLGAMLGLWSRRFRFYTRPDAGQSEQGIG